MHGQIRSDQNRRKGARWHKIDCAASSRDEQSTLFPSHTLLGPFLIYCHKTSLRIQIPKMKNPRGCPARNGRDSSKKYCTAQVPFSVGMTFPGAPMREVGLVVAVFLTNDMSVTVQPQYCQASDHRVKSYTCNRAKQSPGQLFRASGVAHGA